jgi:hypothetical protein
MIQYLSNICSSISIVVFESSHEKRKITVKSSYRIIDFRKGITSIIYLINYKIFLITKQRRHFLFLQFSISKWYKLYLVNIKFSCNQPRRNDSPIRYSQNSIISLFELRISYATILVSVSTSSHVQYSLGDLFSFTFPVLIFKSLLSRYQQYNLNILSKLVLIVLVVFVCLQLIACS